MSSLFAFGIRFYGSFYNGYDPLDLTLRGLCIFRLPCPQDTIYAKLPTIWEPRLVQTALRKITLSQTEILEIQLPLVLFEDNQIKALNWFTMGTLNIFIILITQTIWNVCISQLM